MVVVRRLDPDVAPRVAAELHLTRTELEAARAELQTSSAKLETANDALRAANEALQQQVDELKEAATAGRHKDEFLAMLAHELRTPLAPILSAVQILRRQDTDNPTVQRAREVVERQALHQARLLDDLLDVSRITRGKIELRRRPVSLAGALTEALESTRALIHAKAQSIAVELPEEPLFVDADPTRLAQIITNLVNNAAKYTPAGGRIAVACARDGGQAVILVRDNGAGIPPEMLPRIFDLFTQAEPSSARTHGGLGIGLTLVKNLVEMQGGSVVARSRGRGTGSEFEVRLPAIAAPDVEEPRAGAAGALRRMRVLVVEDNADTRETLRRVLELDGHEVQEAADGPEGVEIALSSRPEAVIVDIGLPGLDGYEVARRVRAALGEAPLLVALTGYGQAEDRRQSREAGFDVHLVKPVSPEQLAAALASGRVGEAA
jgi:signal transduction histidine kinase/ActR/RegA family two-component response regulator